MKRMIGYFTNKYNPEEDAYKLIEYLRSCIQAGMNIDASILYLAKILPDNNMFKKDLIKIEAQLVSNRALPDVLFDFSQSQSEEFMVSFYSSLSIASRSGSNSIKLLRTLADRISQRRTLYRKIRSLTAQMRLQSHVVGILPLALFIVLGLFDVKRVEVFFNTSFGIFMLCSVYYY